MGIPSYFSYIVKNHINILVKLSSNNIKFNNLYLDCNSIIYDSFNKIEKNFITENISNIIISNVIQTITEYIQLLKPNENVFIAFDGVAPVAKLEQQRSRRFKSIYQNNFAKSIVNNNNNYDDNWSTANITPGTLFMKELDKKIKLFFNNPLKFNLKNIIVSGSDIYGEGEHKIFKYIRENSNNHKDKNTIIYGLDADLIMLSINHLPISPNIYLFRETPEFIKSINSELEPNENYLLDIPEFSKNIITYMNNETKEYSNEQKNNKIYDYIFLCFFLGNDFMPHFPALNLRTNGIDNILEAYKQTIGGTNENLTNGKIIYWKNVRKLVKFLADNELTFFKYEHKIRDKYEKNKIPNLDKINCLNNIPIYERNIEKFINPYKENWEKRYYEALFYIKIDYIRKKQICINYLEGLEWTMKYYTLGCPDWRWKYKYNYPPLLCDLIEYIPYFENEFLPIKPDNPVTELVQLIYVLPKNNLSLLPEKIYKELIYKNLDWYKTECEFNWSYCKYFWESHPDLPNININDIEDFITHLE
jgi:5'-3' exonuclease